MSGSRCQSGDNRAGPGKASCGQEVRLRGSGQSRTVSSSPLGSITTGNASFGHVVTLRRCLPGRVVSAVPRRRRRLVCLPGTRPTCSSAEPRRPRVLTRVGPCPCPGRGTACVSCSRLAGGRQSAVSGAASWSRRSATVPSCPERGRRCRSSGRPDRACVVARAERASPGAAPDGLSSLQRPQRSPRSSKEAGRRVALAGRPHCQARASVDVCFRQAPQPLRDSRATRCSAGPLARPRHVPRGPRSSLGQRLATSPCDRHTLSPDIFPVVGTRLR